MTNKFVITFIILAGIFVAGFGIQKVQAGCTEYWDCPTGNYCSIKDPPKTPGSGTCVSNGTPPQPPPVNNNPPPASGGSCAGKTHTADCGTCGAPDQGQCGVGDNSDTCNCNTGNSSCDSNAESNGAGGCRVKSGGGGGGGGAVVPPPAPVPAPGTNPGRCGGVPCSCGASKCDTHSTNNGVDYVCVRGVDNGYPGWACSSGVWVRSGVTPPPPAPAPAPVPKPNPNPAPGNLSDCSAYRADLLECSSSLSLQGANVCTSGGKTLSCCQNGKKIDAKTNSCVSTTSKTCTGSPIAQSCSSFMSNPACSGTITQVCDAQAGVWAYSAHGCSNNCPPALTPPTDSWCNKSCTVQNSNSNCPYGFTCNGTGCRNTSCMTETDCICHAPTPTPASRPTPTPTPNSEPRYNYNSSTFLCVEAQDGYYSSLLACQQNYAVLRTPYCISEGKAFCTSTSNTGSCLTSVTCAPGERCVGQPGLANCTFTPPAPTPAPTPVATKTPFCMPQGNAFCTRTTDTGSCMYSVTCAPGERCVGQPGLANCTFTPPAPTPAPTPVAKATPYCIVSDYLCTEYDVVNKDCHTRVDCRPGVCLIGNNTCTAKSYGVVITGKVQGSIISNALITFFAGDKKVQGVTTDSVGNFSLTLDQKAIEENTEFVITVEKQGYKTFKTTWRPGQGVSYFMQIQLEKGDLKDNGGQANINAQGVSYQLDAGWNFVSINLQSEINTASKLTEAINRQSGQVVFISRWLGDRWESYVSNAGSIDFAVEPGKSYMIKVGKKSEFTISGNPRKDSSTTVEKGWNAVSFPLLEKQTVTADGKLKALNGSVISRFSSGLWDTYARLGSPIQVYGNDYELDSRQGYFVKVE